MEFNDDATGACGMEPWKHRNRTRSGSESPAGTASWRQPHQELRRHLSSMTHSFSCTLQLAAGGRAHVQLSSPADPARRNTVSTECRSRRGSGQQYIYDGDAHSAATSRSQFRRGPSLCNQRAPLVEDAGEVRVALRQETAQLAGYRQLQRNNDGLYNAQDQTPASGWAGSQSGAYTQALPARRAGDQSCRAALLLLMLQKN